jgi:RHS repeat-associated protein
VSYDGAGSVKGFNDSVAGNWTVTNDNLHRMSKVTGALGGVAATATETYDHFGNRNVEYLTSNGNQQQPSPYLNFTSGNNRVSNWSYDNAGNLLSDGSNNYLYDAENRLCAVQPLPPLTGTFGYFYAANGPLLALGNLTSFTCDLTKNGILTGGGSLTNVYMAGPQGERLIETDGSFNLKHYNVFWEGKLLGTFTGATDVQTNWHFALNDWLGTKRVTTTSAGAPWTSIISAPFGDFQSQTGPGTDPSEEHFTSKVRDPNSNLDYFGARYYNSNLGRFMSPDWSAHAEPVPYASLGNPQSLNLYAYVNDNPLSQTDGDGHIGDCPLIIAGAGGGDCVPGGVVVQTPPSDGETGGAQVGEATKMQSGAAIPGTLGMQFVGGYGIGKLGVGLLGELFSAVSSWFLPAVIDLSGLTTAERQIVAELTAQGDTVVPIARGAGKTADFLVNGVETELKTLDSAGTNTLKNAIQSAAKQTNQNILIDARNVGINSSDVVSQIQRAQGNVGNLSGRVTVLTQDGVVKY